MENIILTTEEDITEFSDTEQVKVQVVNMEIRQKCWIDGEKREFMIFNGKQCYQKVEYRKGGKKKFRVNLSYLDAIPGRQISYAYQWLIPAVLLLTIAILAVLGYLNGYPIESSTVISLVGLGVLVGIPVLAIGAIKSTCRITFVSHYGRAPILELINASPNTRTYMTFIDYLQQKINSYNHPKDGDMRSYLRKELDELRRLKNESVLSPAEFNAAMQKIVSNRAYKL